MQPVYGNLKATFKIANQITAIEILARSSDIFVLKANRQLYSKNKICNKITLINFQRVGYRREKKDQLDTPGINLMYGISYRKELQVKLDCIYHGI